MDAVDVLRAAVKEARETGQLTAIEIEFSFQNGVLKHARDSAADTVPAALAVGTFQLPEIEEKFLRVVEVASRGRMFGVVRVQFAVLGERLSGYSCYRERNHKPV